MLQIEKYKLTLTDPLIKSSDSILRLEADIDATFIGVLALSNQSIKILNFIKTDKEYQARLVITTEDINYVKGSHFFIMIVDGYSQSKTNVVKFEFNLELIKQDIRVETSLEMQNLFTRMAQVESTVDAFTKGKVITKLNVLAKEYIKPGMVPMCIDSNGNCVMTYPYSNHITSVNGQKAANGVVEIDASMIQYKESKTIEEELTELTSAIVALNELASEVIKNQKEIRHLVDNLDIKLQSHINSGII